MANIINGRDKPKYIFNKNNQRDLDEDSIANIILNHTKLTKHITKENLKKLSIEVVFFLICHTDKNLEVIQYFKDLGQLELFDDNVIISLLEYESSYIKYFNDDRLKKLTIKNIVYIVSKQPSLLYNFENRIDEMDIVHVRGIIILHPHLKPNFQHIIDANSKSMVGTCTQLDGITTSVSSVIWGVTGSASVSYGSIPQKISTTSSPTFRYIATGNGGPTPSSNGSGNIPVTSDDGKTLCIDDKILQAYKKLSCFYDSSITEKMLDDMNFYRRMT